MKQISAIDIKKVYHCDPSKIATDLDEAKLKALLADNEAVQEVLNIHQDTWGIEEAEASQDSYTNQLTKSVYRMSAKTMGALTVNFTIGRYDYLTKKELMGGELIKKGEEVVGWKRARGAVELYKGIVALTVDDVYLVLPYASMSAREANTDGAIGLAVAATMMEPTYDGVAPEYWFDKDAVDAAQLPTG